MLPLLAAGESRRPPVGVLHIPQALFAPRALFSRVEDVAVYGWPLVILLVTVALIGYAYVETGLIDREIDLLVEQQVAQLEMAKIDIVERSELKKQIDTIREGGEFIRLMAKLGVGVFQPIRILVSVLLIPAFFYGLVALTGRKPEWHTLITICVYASFVDALGLLFRLVLMLRYATWRVETSLAALILPFRETPWGEGASANTLSAVLAGFEPFALWFWVVVAIGLSATSQLRGWKVWTACGGFFLLGTASRVAVALLGTGATINV